MDATSLLLIAFHLICMSTMGLLFGLQFVHLIEYELKIVERYSNFRAILSVLITLFLVWVLAVIGGFDEKHWVLSFLYVFCMCLSVYLTINILFKKKRISWSGKRIES